jgi:hypothetical protein
VTTIRVACALALSALLLGAPSLAFAQGSSTPGMTGMSGMDMSHDIMIPQGALYTVATSERCRG